MNDIDAAWAWYRAARETMAAHERLAEVHWPALPWDGALGRESHFKSLEADSVAENARLGLAHLDDLSVLVLFSVFEHAIRDIVLAQIEQQAATLTHPTLKHLAAQALEAVRDGSFFRVLEPFKSAGHADLVEEVN